MVNEILLFHFVSTIILSKFYTPAIDYCRRSLTANLIYTRCTLILSGALFSLLHARETLIISYLFRSHLFRRSNLSLSLFRANRLNPKWSVSLRVSSSLRLSHSCCLDQLISSLFCSLSKR
jgi:hypothetical protein